MTFPTSETTIAEHLKQHAGYHNMLVGKWHLGHSQGHRPEERGFDETIGFNLGASLYLNANDGRVVNEKVNDFADDFLWGNLRFFVVASNATSSDTFDPDEYLTGISQSDYYFLVGLF